MTHTHPVPLILGDGWQGDRPGGLNRYVAGLFDALREHGLQPRCVVFGPAEGAPDGVVPAALPSQPLGMRLWRFRRQAGRVGVGAGVVDAHFAINALASMRLSALSRKPLVVHFHGPWADESRVEGEHRRSRLAAKRAVELAVYRRASRAIVLSNAFKRVLVEGYRVLPWRVEVVPPGVDLDVFRPGSRGDARRRLGLEEASPVVVSVRRLEARMGLDVLLEAWAVLDVPGAVLLLVGAGQERGNLEALSERLGIADSVRFLGRLGDAALVDCYRASDVVVVPTVALEGFGLTVLEALACGRPVIVTAVGGLPEVVAPLDPSLVVEPGDPKALAARIGAGLDGTKPLPEPARCRGHAESYTWARAAARHAAIYGDAVRSRHLQRRAGKLRVVYLDHCALLSGGELALLRLLPALTEVDAHVILAQEGPLAARLTQAGVSVEVLRMPESARDLHRESVRPGRLPVASVLHSTLYTLRLALRLRRLRPDLVHTNSLKSALYGGIAGRLARVPVVWHVRDRIAEDYLPTSAVRLVKRLSSRLPTAVIANSRSTLEALGDTAARQTIVPSPVILGVGGRGAQSRIVVHDAVRFDASDLAGHDATEVPVELTLRVGMLGRLAPWKGQHIFLDAFARSFAAGRTEAVVVGAALFGEAAYEEELRRQVVDLGLEGRVDFRGFREDMIGELGRLDIVVHASVTPEPFGQVVVEAMAMGLPVIAANAGGPAEIVTDGVTGLLFPPGDTDALSAALTRLSMDPVLRARLGDAGRGRAGDFSPDVVGAMVMSVYSDVVGDLAYSEAG